MLHIEEVFNSLVDDQTVRETYLHALQVAVLSIATGVQMELDREQLINLGKLTFLLKEIHVNVIRQLTLKNSFFKHVKNA
ncbi:hypothetical protein [Aneurinibacillus terranovensis]|uniref:hypothetical protein n=1 Tax=Aneurinibacillus terranovensis TaxID=278991 RepID=UPI00040EF5B3